MIYTFLYFSVRMCVFLLLFSLNDWFERVSSAYNIYAYKIKLEAQTDDILCLYYAIQIQEPGVYQYNMRRLFLNEASNFQFHIMMQYIL